MIVGHLITSLSHRAVLVTLRLIYIPRRYRKLNIFDNMMAIMERYATKLEEIVEERTDQLREEKKRTEALLNQMLPR